MHVYAFSAFTYLLRECFSTQRFSQIVAMLVSLM